MFFNAGTIVVDVVLSERKGTRYPYEKEYLTPHYGAVTDAAVIEIRLPPMKE